MSHKETLHRELDDLRAEASKIFDEQLSADRSLTEEERVRLDNITERLDAINQEMSDLQRYERHSSREAQYAALQPSKITDDFTPAPVVEDRTKYDAWPAEEADKFFKAVQCRATNSPLPGDMHDDLRATFADAMEYRNPTGQGTLIDSDGGFLVPSTVAASILQKSHGEGTLIGRTQNVPITVGNSTTFNAIKENSRVSGSRYGGITVNRDGEGDAATGTKASLAQVELKLKKITALVYATDEQLADGPQMVTILNDLVPKAIQFKVEDELFNGDGVTQFEGLLNAAATVSVAKESGQAASTVVFQNIVNIYSRMHAASRANSVFVINQDIEPQLFTMSLAVGDGGVPVYMPANGAAGSPFGTLMGRPVIPSEHCATLGTVGDIILADFSQYLHATKGGVQSAQSIHVNFTQSETAFRFVLRNDGRPWWPAALTPANGSNTQSPFVSLATRS